MGAKSEAEVLGKDDFEFYPKELANEFFNDDQSVMQNGSAIIIREECLPGENKQKRWLLSSKLALRDYYGQIVGLLGIGRDITERKAAEKNLQESLTKYQVLFKYIPLGITVTDVDGNIIERNQKADELLGLSKEEQLKRRITGEEWLIVKDDGSPFPQGEYASVLALKENRLVENVEMGIIKEEGNITWLNETAAPIPLENFGVAIAYSDISERIRTNKLLMEKTEQVQVQNKEYVQINEELNQTVNELVKARNKAEESDKLKSAFLANMSHEIRTPMNGILGFAELLKEPHLSGEEQQHYIGMIEKGGPRLLNIINNLISISKVESGQLEVSLTEMNISEQIESVYNFLKPEVERKRFKIFFKSILPLKAAIIKPDHEKFYSVLTNLVNNAIKFTSEGSIEFGYKKRGNYLEFFVKDTGIGIPRVRQDAIFERSIQADILDKGALQGAGLGLAISKAYVEILGGKIWVESEPAKGSIFYFTIPCN